MTPRARRAFLIMALYVLPGCQFDAERNELSSRGVTRIRVTCSRAVVFRSRAATIASATNDAVHPRLSARCSATVRRSGSCFLSANAAPPRADARIAMTSLEEQLLVTCSSRARLLDVPNYTSASPLFSLRESVYTAEESYKGNTVSSREFFIVFNEWLVMLRKLTKRLTCSHPESNHKGDLV